VLIKLLFSQETGSYGDIDALQLVQAGMSENNGKNTWKDHPINNKTLLNSLKGKNWTDLDEGQRHFLIKRWLCKKRNCDLA
jgi:hypothetical protein